METVNRAACISVTDPTRVSEARRAALELATRLGFNEERAGKVAIVCTELATNLLKHSVSGDILIVSAAGDLHGVDLLALDKGPGMTNIAECLRDGYSTAGSPGTGLGAIERLSDSLDIFTEAGRGTAIAARLWSAPKRHPEPPRGIEIAGFSVPMKGEPVSGDAWSVRRARAGCTVLVADGLGHGILAAEAAESAVRAFESAGDAGPAELLDRIHGALRSTRGAAGAIAQIDVESRQIRYVGVGNVASFVVGPDRTHNLVSMNGILGHEIRTLREFEYAWPSGATLILCSDGISTRVNVAEYPGLLARSCPLIAGIIFRDYWRGRDDATVVVARERPA